MMKDSWISELLFFQVPHLCTTCFCVSHLLPLLSVREAHYPWQIWYSIFVSWSVRILIICFWLLWAFDSECDSEVHVTALLETLMHFQLILILYIHELQYTNLVFHYPSTQLPAHLLHRIPFPLKGTMKNSPSESIYNDIWRLRNKILFSDF